MWLILARNAFQRTLVCTTGVVLVVTRSPSSTVWLLIVVRPDALVQNVKMMSQCGHAYWFGVWIFGAHREPQRGQQISALAISALSHSTETNAGLYLRNASLLGMDSFFRVVPCSARHWQGVYWFQGRIGKRKRTTTIEGYRNRIYSIRPQTGLQLVQAE